MKCEHSDKSCEWDGTVDQLESHLSKCEYVPIYCPKCSGKLMRKDLKTHLANDCSNRDYECAYCGEEGTFASITQIHFKSCPMKEIPCPNVECKEVLKRKRMKWHVENCDLTEVPCKYRRVGCDVKLKRSAMPEHEENNDRIHLRMALEKACLEEEKEITLSSERSITFKLTDYEQKRERNEVFTFPSFYLSAYGCHLALKVHTNGIGSGKGTHLSVSIRVIAGKHDSKLTWPLTGKVTVTLLNQQEDNDHYSKILDLEGLLVDDTSDSNDFVSRNDLEEYVEEPCYVEDDNMYFRVSAEITDIKPWLITPPLSN